MTQTLSERLNAAAGSPDPGLAMRNIVRELAASGWQQSQVYEGLEDYLLELRANHDRSAATEDAVLDVMDAVVDWCHPDVRLMPESNRQ